MRVIKYLLFLCLFTTFKSVFSQLELQEAFPNLTFSTPVEIQNPGDGTDRLFIVEKPGRIIVFENNRGTTTTKIFLDITDRVNSNSTEMGLLGLAFHPNYKNNGYFYVDYTATGPVSTISRFKVSPDNPDSADKNSELILLTQAQPYANHNGGKIAFGPDGYLYIGFGDGGSGGDPNDNAQNLSVFLGKILRIDVNNMQDGMNYSIPPDNPFANNTQGYKQEIFAYGLRNPWRFSFDPVTGKNWCADVGQSNWEEIDIIKSGNNYGWRCYEGDHTYNFTNCNGPDYTFPIWEYDHSNGNCSITGGYVIRGMRRPELNGTYVYGDYCSGRIWQLIYNDSANNQFLLTTPSQILTFGTDMNNELYICCSNGKIYQFKPAIDEPLNLSVSATVPGIVNLSWQDQSNNESGFKIQRKGSNNIFETVGTVEANVTTFDNNVTQIDEYTYRVYGFTNNAVSNYSNEAIIDINSSSLPVELVTFTAEYLNDKVILNWKTLTEKNNRGFEVERYSKNKWNSLTFISGNGTTTASNTYNFTDELKGVDYNEIILYRLKQINYDGSFSYSKEVATKILKPRNFILFQNYPNPFNPETKISWESPIDSRTTIKIFDMLGYEVTTLINEIIPSGKHEITFNSEKLPDGNPSLSSGIYYILFSAGNNILIKKIVLLK